jgi:hypothetical protein
MKKGLHVIRLLWKGAWCHLPPPDDTYYGAPTWGDSPLKDVWGVDHTPDFLEEPDFLAWYECYKAYQRFILYHLL